VSVTLGCVDERVDLPCGTREFAGGGDALDRAAAEADPHAPPEVQPLLEGGREWTRWLVRDAEVVARDGQVFAHLLVEGDEGDQVCRSGGARVGHRRSPPPPKILPVGSVCLTSIGLRPRSP